MTARGEPPVVLVISGLDPSGGAGFILDLAVIAEHGAVGCGAITAQTVQDSRGARRCEPVSEEILGEQLAALLSDIEVAGVKIGLVPSEPLATVIAGALAQTSAPIVWDPVFSASAGATLLHDDPRAIADALAPECTLITPNLGEAAVLAADGDRLRQRFGCDVLLTGGHARGDEATDVLFTASASRAFSVERVPGPSPRGTGCYLSSAIATRLALGSALGPAIEGAKAALTKRLRGARSRGRGAPVLF